MSQDSYGWNGNPTDNMWGEARRGAHGTAFQISTGERAYELFDATGYGDGDIYLEYTEDFDFSFDVTFSSFVEEANDERLFMGLYYDPDDIAGEDHNLGTHRGLFATRSYTVCAAITEDGTDVRLNLFYANGGVGPGARCESIDLTGGDSLALDTDYRILAHYRYDGATYGQLYGEIYEYDAVGDTWFLKWGLSAETITGGPHDVAWTPFPAANQQFTLLSEIGVSNETWGSTRSPGAEFTSDNWWVGTMIPEPGTVMMLLFGMGALVARLNKRK